MDLAVVSSRNNRLSWALFWGVIISLHTVEATISCQFTSGYCGWTPEPADRWLLSENVITSTGQLLAATEFNGASGAALIRSNKSDAGMFATLVSEEISLNTSATLSFWVHLSEPSTYGSSRFNAAGYLNAIQANGTNTTVWSYSQTSSSSSAYRQQITVTLPPRQMFQLEFRLFVNRFYSGFIGIVLHPEGVEARFLSCTFGSGLCAWENAGQNETQWGLNIAFPSYAPPTLSADNQFLVANSKATSGSHTAILRSPMMYSSDPSELSFFYRCYRASTSSTPQLTISAETNIKRVALPRYDSWEHAYILANASENIVFEITAVLPPGCHCSIDEISWTGDENGYSLATTTIMTVEPTTPVPTPEPCHVPAPIVVQCQRGNLTFSETNFDLSDALQAELYGDNTLKCRHILRDMHKWILRQPHQIGGERSTDAIHVLCNAETTLRISHEDPELAESVNLIYTAGANTPCRSVFLGFLKALVKLA